MTKQATRKLSSDDGLDDGIELPDETLEVSPVTDSERAPPPPQRTISVGAQLHEARKASHLSLEEASARLYLEIRILKALEEDDYERLPEAIFVQGYLRNYSKLLEIDPEPLINQYFQTTKRAPPRLVPDSAHEPPEVQASSRDPWFKLMTVVLLAALVAAVVLWWQSSQAPFNWKLPGSGGGGETSVPAPTRLNLPDEGGAEETDKALPVGEVLDTSSDATFTPPSETALPPTATEMAETATGEPAPAATPGQAAATTPMLLDEAVGEAVEQPVAVEAEALKNTVVIKAAKDCWTEVYDRDSKRLFVGTLAAGIQQSFTGPPPFRMVLGRPQDVEVTYQGQPVDLRNYYGIIARFRLGE